MRGLICWIAGPLLCSLPVLQANSAPPGQAQQPSGPTVPSRPDELLRARLAINAEHWPEAESILRAYLAAKGDSAEPLYLLGFTLLRENRPKDSLEAYTRAARFVHPSALALRYVALDYVLLNDFPDADRWLTLSLKENRTDGEAWYALGRVKYSENRFGEALSCFQQTLIYLSQSVKTENNLGLAFEALNKPEEAIKAYRQAITWQQGAAHPSPEPLLNLGVLLTNRNMLDDALMLLVQAEKLAPSDSRIHSALGTLYARRLAFPQAQVEYEQAVAAEPNNAALHFQLGQVYRKEGDEARAKQELARAAALEGRKSSPEP